jgi:drug/metabolite transporter (DMT)-like permease
MLFAQVVTLIPNTSEVQLFGMSGVVFLLAGVIWLAFGLALGVREGRWAGERAVILGGFLGLIGAVSVWIDSSPGLGWDVRSLGVLVQANSVALLSAGLAMSVIFYSVRNVSGTIKHGQRRSPWDRSDGGNYSRRKTPAMRYDRFRLR